MPSNYGLKLACRLNTSTHCTQPTFYFTAHQLTCISQLSQLHTTGTNWYQNHQKIILTNFNNPHHFLQTRDAIKHSFCRFLFISTSYTNGVNYMFFLLASKMTKLFKSLSTSRSFQPCHLVTYLEKKTSNSHAYCAAWQWIYCGYTLYWPHTHKKTDII